MKIIKMALDIQNITNRYKQIIIIKNNKTKNVNNEC